MESDMNEERRTDTMAGGRLFQIHGGHIASSSERRAMDNNGVDRFSAADLSMDAPELTVVRVQLLFGFLDVKSTHAFKEHYQ
jgi:hypothetical protein